MSYAAAVAMFFSSLFSPAPSGGESSVAPMSDAGGGVIIPKKEN
ncbi:hypothetical protein [Pseudoalteromonas sp. C2R02]|nr:hypothetical protein [Pseudoalteromonas sp. C2R02]